MSILTVHLPPYEGDYEYEDDRLPSGKEWRWIHQISGYLPLTIHEGFAGADPNLYIALSVVAMVRKGKISPAEALAVAEALQDPPFDGSVVTAVVTPREEDGADPLEVQPAVKPSDGQPSSGDDSSASGDASPENVSQLRSGLQVSATGSGFAQGTSES